MSFGYLDGIILPQAAVRRLVTLPVYGHFRAARLGPRVLIDFLIFGPVKNEKARLLKEPRSPIPITFSRQPSDGDRSPWAVQCSIDRDDLG